MTNWQVEENGAALETQGITFVKGSYSLSPVAILTFGFIVGTQDIWTDCDAATEVTWTDCSCE
jgi:hypothetical protein